MKRYLAIGCMVAMGLAVWGWAGTALAADEAADNSSSATSAAPAEAPSATVDSLIAAADKTLSTIKDVSADMTMTATGPGGAPTTGKGTMKAMPPNRMVMFLTMQPSAAGGEMTARVVRSGMVLYTEQKGNGQTQVAKLDLAALEEAKKAKSLPKAMTDRIRPPEFQGYLKSARDAGVTFKVVKTEGDMVTLEGAYPTTVAQGTAKTTVVVDSKDGLPRSIKDFGPDGSLAGAIEFTNMKFDTGLKAEEMEYKVPEGVQVIDMIEMLKAAAAMMQGAAGQGEAAPAPGSD